MQSGDPRRRNALRTYLGYFGFLAIILVIVGYASREVVFRPWTSRSGGAVVSVGDTAYVIGGRSANNTFYADILALDFRAGTLKHAGRLPAPEIGASAAELGEAVYIAGGWNGTRVTDAVLRYDPKSRELQEIGRLPSPRAFGALVAFHGGLYYLGGWDGSSVHDEITWIDPKTGGTSLTGRLPSPNQLFASTATDGAVFVIGGESQTGRSIDAIDAIDPSNGRLLAHGSLPQPRERASAVLLGDRIYVAGGVTGLPVPDLLSIDPSSPTLAARVVGFPSTDNADVALTAAGGVLYLVGGEEVRLQRQIGVLRVDPRTAQTRSIVLASYVWW